MQYTSTAIVAASAAAPGYNLTDLTTVKSELGLQPTDTSQDAFLNRGITQISKAIKNHCNRVFHVESVTDTIFVDRAPEARSIPGHAVTLPLSRWPVLSVSSVIALTSPLTTTAYIAGTDYLLKADVGQLIRLHPTTGIASRWKDAQVTVSYVAGYGAQVSEPQTVPANPGPYTVTVANAATFSIDQGVTYAIGGAALAAVAFGTAPAVGQYSVDTRTTVSGNPNPNLGQYLFNAADQAKGVVIAYAYNQIPDDLVDACLREVTERFKGKGRDPLLMSQNQPGLGDQRWWIGGAPGQSGAFPPEVESLLAPYRVPVVG